MKYKTFENYRNSGIEWMGEIPEHWETRRLKYILNERNEKNNPIKTENILSLTAIQGVVPYSEKEASGGNKHKDDLSAYKLAYPGDIVLNSMNIVTGSVGLSNYYGCVSPVYYMFYSNDEEINIQYYNYIFQSKVFQTSLLGLGNGILLMTSKFGNLYAVRMKIPIDKLKNLIFPIPPKNVQDNIVDYLNFRIKNINKIINKEKELISLLEEKKAALINQIVTKGLDSNVPMKDSGIDIIGDIPINNKIIRLKFLCSIVTGDKDTINKNPEGQYPFYVRSPIIEKIDSYSFDGEAILMAGDGVGAGKVFHYANGKFDFHQRVYNLHNFKRVFPKFLYYYMSNLFSIEVEKGSAKSTVDSIRLPMLNNFKICLPNFEEQKIIVNYLDQEISNINKIVEKIQEYIKFLEEYKTSLIYHVVTGKIDVRDEI